MSIYTVSLPKTCAALLFTSAISFCGAMEKATDDLNTPVTARISYFCPQMTVPHKDVSFLSVQFPNGSKIQTKESNWSNNGGRHTLSYNGQEIQTVTLNPQNMTSPYTLIVNIMTGYMNQGKLESWEPIHLTLNKEMITPNLEAIRITHSPKSVRDMRIQYNYTK